ncbi:hypothetical protein PG984_013148 [Apiospora sp. TS-2023a]
MNETPDRTKGDQYQMVAEPDSTWEDLKLGMFVRQDKYAKVYSVVTSDWTAEAQWEAHVFELQGKQRARFFERMIWPKMRKSSNYEADFLRDSTHIFVRRLVEDIDPVDAKHTKAKRKKARQAVMAASSSDCSAIEGDVRNNPAKEEGIDTVAFVKQAFIRYCVRVGKPVPKFKGGQLTTDMPSWMERNALRDEGAKELWGSLKRDARVLVSERNCNTTGNGPGPDEGKSPMAVSGARNTSSRSSRPLPQDRDVEMILDLAKMIEAEPIYCTSDGQSQPGRSFFLKHLYPQTHLPEDSTREELAAKQQDWTGRLTRLVERIPSILKTLTKRRDQIWKASIPSVLQVFGDIEDGQIQDGDGEIGTIWLDVLGWMIEEEFGGFDSAAVQALAQGLSVAYAPTTTSWFFRIRRHVKVYKWAESQTNEGVLQKELGTPEAVPVRMLLAHTRRELVIGMRPLLERMAWISELTFKYWKCQAAYNEYKAMLSKDSGLHRPSWENASALFSLTSYYPDQPYGVLTDPYPSHCDDETAMRANQDLMSAKPVIKLPPRSSYCDE